MQDALIDIGRSIDGVVGRIVDRLGDPPSNRDQPAVGTADTVELVRYAIVCVRSGRERVVRVDKTLVTDGTTAEQLVAKLLERHVKHDARKSHRVYTRVLRRWPRQPQGVAAVVPAERVPRRSEPEAAESAGKTAPTDETNDRVLAVLEGAGAAGLSLRDLARKTEEPTAALRRRLQRLAKEGAVKRVGEGLTTRYRRGGQLPEKKRSSR